MEGKHSHVDSEKVILATSNATDTLSFNSGIRSVFQKVWLRNGQEGVCNRRTVAYYNPKMGVANTLSINLPKQHEISFSVSRSL